MILRKPYAFLIKNFRKINILIFLLTIYIYTCNLGVLQFARNYTSTGVYNEFDLISNYITPLFIGALLLTIAFSIILTILLKHKDKPIRTYVFLIVEYAFLLGVLIFTRSFFNDALFNGFDRPTSLIVRDLLLIASIPQYIIMLLLLIRSIGLDLQSFGFNDDKGMLLEEEDREEVEIETKFDKDKYKRNIKKVIRKAKYFILENKVYLSIITLVLVLFFTVSIYNVYQKNKVYVMNTDITSNYYTFRVNNSYITNRDYKGDIIDSNASFVVLDLNIKDNYGGRNLQLNRFMLYVGDKYYVPTTEYDEYFKDMGEVYHDQKLSKQSSNYYLVFRVENIKENDNFLLRYQDVTDGGRLIRIKLKIRDISQFITKDEKGLSQELRVPLNLNNGTTIKINTAKISNYSNYSYVSCDIYNNCPAIQESVVAGKDKKILYMSFMPIDKARTETINFIKNYGKIRYTVDDKTYIENIKDAVNRSYYGNYLYYLVSSEIEESSSIELVFTVRSYQYIYKIK